jgi:SAM-dependent methyltransferase
VPTSPAAEDARASYNIDVERHFVHRGRGPEFDMETRFMTAHLRGRDRWVLDVGCGVGALMDAIGASRSIGVDPAWGGLAYARLAHPRLRLVAGDGSCLPVGTGALTAIAAQHVIEHLPDLAATCREWHRVLQPGGLLVVATPNASFVDQSVFADPTHVEIFSAARLTSGLTSAGFEIVDVRSLGLPWFRGVARQRIGWRLRRLVLDRARALSHLPLLRWRGQTLVCVARKR